ncbi:Uncharacterised protein [Shigella sonnei]|nr:Uncharacterised protein [Shigella sonnei]CSG66167.1 Uncharacterised protein [Shigella sonnei]
MPQLSGIFLLNLLIHRIELRTGHQQARLAILQDPRAFLAQQAGVNRHHNRANFCQPEPAKDKFRAVVEM